MRAQEVAMLCGQDFVEKGASTYYDPKSSNFHGYSAEEQSALGSLKSGSSFVTLPVVSQAGIKFEIEYRDFYKSLWSISGSPYQVAGSYDFGDNTLNIMRVYITVADDNGEHEISANDIMQVVDLHTGVIMNGLEWVKSLQIDTAKIDEIAEIRARFSKQFGRSSPRRVAARPRPVPLADTAKFVKTTGPNTAPGYRFLQALVIGIFIFAVVASLIGGRR